MQPITSEQKNFMTFPVEDEDHDILFLQNGTPVAIGSLPASITEEEMPAVLKFLDAVYTLGVQRGERVGKRTVARAIRQTCQDIESNNS